MIKKANCVLALILVALVLGACGTKQEATPKAETAAPAVETPKVVPGEMVLIPAGIFIWFLGFASSNIRPIVRADTPGPPPEHRMWSITKRRQRKRATQDLVKAIEQGRLTAEPPGTRLEEI